MLNNNKTQDKFGYKCCELSEGSNKPIILNCDYCGAEINSSPNKRKKLNKFINKDACFGCRFKKRADVSLSKYGVANVAQTQKVRQKISKASAKRLSSEEYKEEYKNIMLKKYGVEYAMHSDEIKAKQKRTVIEKYGVENISQLEEIKQKVKQTTLQNHGVSCGLLTQQAKLAVQDKYGVDNVFQSEEIKQKIKQTNLTKYGYEHHFKDPEKAKENARKVLKSKIKSGKVKLYNGKTIAELRNESGYSDSRFRKLIHDYGYELALQMTPRESSLEVAMSNILDLNCQKQVKISKYYADFVIDNIVVECDGLYWHSERGQSNNNYHVEKRAAYIEAGYRPFFFREDEILNKSEIIKSIIYNALGRSQRLYARKTEVREIKFQDAFKFVEDNHLMGGVRNVSNSFGLFSSGELVAVLQMRRMKNKDYDISRFCCAKHINIVGGFSKLLQFFKRNYSPDMIQTFIDLRYGTGEYLPSLGFVLASCHKSFVWTNGEDTFHRLKFRGNSGYNLGLVKLFDCGQARFEYK